jgi:hypothetical protein
MIDKYAVKFKDQCTAPNLLVITFFFSLYAFTQTLIFGSRFGANDDFVMSQLANGGFTGEASKYLLFINVIIGHVLSFCYQIVPGVQWYPLFQVLSMAFACAVFTCSGVFKLGVFNLGSRSIRMFFALVLFVVMCSQFMAWVFSINYSTTAYFCSTLGCLSLLLSARVKPSSIAFAPIVVCFLGFLWRPQAFISVVPVFLVVLLFQIRIVSIKSIFKNISCLTLLLLAASFFDRWTYVSSSKWKDFYFYNSLRGKVHGNSVFELMVEQVGVSEIAKTINTPAINLRFFGQWFYSTTTTRAQSLEHAVRLIGEDTVISELRLGRIALSQTIGISLVVAPLVVFILLLKAKRKAPLVVSISSIVFYLVFAESYLGQFIRLPSYVIEGLRFSSIFGLLAVLMFGPHNDSHAVDTSRVFRVLLLVLFLPFALYANRLIGTLSDNSSSSNRNHEQFIVDAKLIQQSLSVTAIDLTESFDPSILSPWSNFKLTSLSLIPVGWITSSPAVNERLNYFGVFEELDTAMISGKISVLSLRDSLTLQMLSDYLNVNYAVCGTWNTDSKTSLPHHFVLSDFKESEECVSAS